MPRKARDERLDTRTARLTLKPRREPYWRSIQDGRALGYRRAAGGRAGTWIARHYDAAGGRKFASIGVADDMLDADGATTLTWTQAQELARAWWQQTERDGGRVVAPVTVATAIDDYLIDYRARLGKAEASMRRTINAHILPALGRIEVAKLTFKKIRDWRNGLANAPARLRTSTTSRVPNVRVAKGSDALRARRSTANRVLTVLKAALTYSFEEGKVPSDDAWRRVKPFEKVDAPKVAYLTDDQSVRLVMACPADLRKLVTAALLTGCRFSELTGLRVGDFDEGAGLVHVRAAKAGARTAALTEDGRRFFRQETAGKARDTLILPRAGGAAWGTNHQFRPLRKACADAKIIPAASFHILRHTFASRLAMKGVPMHVIAAALGNDEAICARHYAHLSPSYISDTIRQHAGGLDIVPADPPVHPICPAGAPDTHLGRDPSNGNVVPFKKRGAA